MKYLFILVFLFGVAAQAEPGEPSGDATYLIVARDRVIPRSLGLAHELVGRHFKGVQHYKRGLARLGPQRQGFHAVCVSYVYNQDLLRDFEKDLAALPEADLEVRRDFKDCGAVVRWN